MSYVRGNDGGGKSRGTNALYKGTLGVKGGGYHGYAHDAPETLTHLMVHLCMLALHACFVHIIMLIELAEYCTR